MKLFCIALISLCCFNISAQEKKLKSNTFLRVYNLQGKKMAKGKLSSTNNNTLTLKRFKKPIIIPVDSIGYIKTKRSVGNNLLTGSAIGAGSVIILSTGSDESFTEGYTGIGTLLFTGVGASVGAITAMFKNSRIFQIDGDKEKWDVFVNLLMPED